MAGRPTKLTPDLQSKMVNLIRAGNYIETASAACGLSKDTFYRWIKEGARLAVDLKQLKLLAGKKRQEASALIEFSEAIEKAQAASEARDLLTIDRAAQGRDVERVVEKYEWCEKTETMKLIERTSTREREVHWQAAAWRLERKNYDHWGRKERHELTGASGTPLIPEADLDACLGKLVKKVTAKEFNG